MSIKLFKQNINKKNKDIAGGPYTVQMLFKNPVDMPSKDQMISVMKKHIGSVECFCYDEKVASFGLLEKTVEFQDGKFPVQLMIMGCNSFEGEGIDDFIMSQMWDCQEEKERIFEECKFMVVATDMVLPV